MPHFIDETTSKTSPLFCAAITFSLGRRNHQTLRFVHRRTCLRQPPPHRHADEGGTMELKMRLNVLAALMSFAFLAAVVFGMI
jgi:hypothetical protein